MRKKIHQATIEVRFLVQASIPQAEHIFHREPELNDIADREKKQKTKKKQAKQYSK